MSPLCLAVFHLLADLQRVIICDYLQKLDTDDAALTDNFGLSKKLVHIKQEFKTHHFFINF